jgi:5S rRNA maturation endonuclease (ribonuclease M5)
MNVQSGLNDCKKCGWQGNIYQLRQEIGLKGLAPIVDYQPVTVEEETPPEPIPQERIEAGIKRLMESKEAMRYITQDRGWNKQIIPAMGLILEEWKDARWIGYPWRQKGEWVGCKYRVLPSDQRDDIPRFRRLKGYKSILYNEDVLDYRRDGQRLKTVILTSGESDCLSMLSMGYRGVVATTVGEHSLPKLWIEQLSEFEHVYVFFDNDDKGQDAAEKVAAKLGEKRARIVRLPEDVKDANDFLKQHGPEAKVEMDRLLKSARPVAIPSVQHITDNMDIFDAGFFGGAEPVEAYTPWANVNERLSRFHGLVVLTAPQNVGKTTFGLQVCDLWAERLKPALFYCLEMTAEELKAKVIMSRYHVTMEELKSNVDNVRNTFVVDYQDRPFYLGYAPLVKSVPDVLALLQAAIDRLDLRIVFFDNVHVLGRSKDARHIIGELSIGLKQLAMDNKITIVAIAQPRKIDAGKIMDRWDVKESVDLLSDADNMIILHRQKIASSKDTEAYGEEVESLLSPYTLVRIEKTRFGGAKDCILYLDGEHHRFRELYPGEKVDYRGKRGAWKQADGWDEGQPTEGQHWTEKMEPDW